MAREFAVALDGASGDSANRHSLSLREGAAQPVLDEFLIILAAQPVVPALAALLIDRLWPRASARPPEMVARVVASLVERLNREGRPAATRQMRG
ncbi:hypothetical protein, partial [Zavarzinia sp.]|uniref:hypothetical protein n=1 Tax=Zavarzinia sp. TaxID=2027920 RepID=UPI003BB500C0